MIVRIADNGQGISDDSEETIVRRGEIGHAKATGSGFGSFVVDPMIDEYGGDVRVEDNEDGGAPSSFSSRTPIDSTDTSRAWIRIDS